MMETDPDFARNPTRSLLRRGFTQQAADKLAAQLATVGFRFSRE